MEQKKMLLVPELP